MNAESERLQKAMDFLKTLPEGPPPIKIKISDIPDYPKETHCAFIGQNGIDVMIRAWDEHKGIYYKTDNPLGPAAIIDGKEKFFLNGKALDRGTWESQTEEPKNIGPRT